MRTLNSFAATLLVIVSRAAVPLAATWMLAPDAAAQGDPARGQAAYVVCAACHGTQAEGNKDLNAPRLAGQNAADLVRQIDNFKKGARGYDPADTVSAAMKPIVQALAGPAIDDIVAYVATLNPPAPTPTVAGDAAAGAISYAICGTCHGAKGEGNPALNGPKLAGQHDWYIVRQIQSFKNGMRGKGPGDVFGPQMAPMALTLTNDAAISNVAAYISTLK
jgi:cytochrome c oxidase subunit 2